MAVVIPYLTTGKLILFYAGIAVLQRREGFIFELPAYMADARNLYLNPSYSCEILYEGTIYIYLQKLTETHFYLLQLTNMTTVRNL
jgi:hypothetical protein